MNKKQSQKYPLKYPQVTLNQYDMDDTDFKSMQFFFEKFDPGEQVSVSAYKLSPTNAYHSTFLLSKYGADTSQKTVNNMSKFYAEYVKSQNIDPKSIHIIMKINKSIRPKLSSQSVIDELKTVIEFVKDLNKYAWLRGVEVSNILGEDISQNALLTTARATLSKLGVKYNAYPTRTKTAYCSKEEFVRFIEEKKDITQILGPEQKLLFDLLKKYPENTFVNNFYLAYKTLK